MERYNLDSKEPFEDRWPNILERFEKIVDESYGIGFNDVVPWLSNDCPYVDRCSKSDYDEPNYKKWNLNNMAMECLKDLDGGFDGMDGDIKRALKWSKFFEGWAKRFKHHAESMQKEITEK